MPLALLSASLIAAAPVHLLELAPAPFAARAPAQLPAPDPVPDPNASTWYGWGPFLADATAVTLFFGGLELGRQGLSSAQLVTIATSIGIYGLGGPLLHWARGWPDTALLDLGLRAGLPVAGAIVGFGLAVLGAGSSLVLPCFVLGILVAMVTDAGGLSWEPPEEGSRPPEQAALRWAPFAGTARGSPLAGISGTF
ncbi:MAG TPA: hypothetical protein VIG99_21335 [Myxococcaceae bacterium]|jgi:hypothetical protein